MNKSDRREIQRQREGVIRKERDGYKFIVPGDSLFQKAHKFGMALDMPFNRATRRTEIKKAISAERTARKKAS